MNRYRMKQGTSLGSMPSGEQFEISWREHRATVVEVGGGIREYEVDGLPVLDPYPVDAMCDGAHGAPLIPWPNRLADGRYRFDGTDYQVALTEPEKHNANHGLARWRSWQAVRQTKNRVTMATRLFPMTGYPFLLDVEVDYRVEDAGLTVSTTATNRGSDPCPYAAGQHPYLSPGSGLIDDCTLEFEAGLRIVTDAERQLPVGDEPVAGTRYDFAAARRLGDQQIDFAFTEVARDADDLAWCRLSRPDGSRAELWADPGYPFIELYTGDTLSPARRRHGLGVEPMTCPPNGLQSAPGVHRLEPNQAVTTSWGVRLS